jgi:alcohol dehydrogenase class IV
MRRPDDIEARGHMMAAALMGAVAFQKGLGAVHAISHPIGAIYGTHHGTTNACVMRAVLRFNRAAVEDRLACAAAYLGIDGGFDGFLAFVNDFNASLGIPPNLTALGVANADLDRLVADALADPSVGGNPVPMTAENTRALFAACLG